MENLNNWTFLFEEHLSTNNNKAVIFRLSYPEFKFFK